MEESEHIIETPLGQVAFEVTTNSGDLSRLKYKCCEFVPVLPSEMSVEKCIVIIMRCSTLAPFRNLSFHCKWKNLQEKGYACSGEGLDAWEWGTDNYTVTVGTEDSDLLKSRMNIKGLNNKNYSVTMSDNKVSINLEEFPENTELTLHYIVAWNPEPEPVSNSCWFAVDQPHEKMQEICK